MQFEIRHNPAFAVTRCFLEPGEVINAEAGAMYAHTFGIDVTSRMRGGLLGSLKRSVLGGESFFITEFQAPTAGGWIDLVPVLGGDMFALELAANRPLILTRGSWIASEHGVQLDTKFGGATTVLGGEGFFTVKASGVGTVIAAAYGALDAHELQANEGFTVDTGHLVAYDDGMQTRVRPAGRKLLSSFKSGEGLVMDIQGPGRVITQSRNPVAFREWLQSVGRGSSSTTPRDTGMGGVLGGIFN